MCLTQLSIYPIPLGSIYYLLYLSSSFTYIKYPVTEAYKFTFQTLLYFPQWEYLREFIFWKLHSQ